MSGRNALKNFRSFDEKAFFGELQAEIYVFFLSKDPCCVFPSPSLFVSQSFNLKVSILDGQKGIVLTPGDLIPRMFENSFGVRDPYYYKPSFGPLLLGGKGAEPSQTYF